VEDTAVSERDITLLETQDRVLNKGVVLSGDITISVADVDLIFVGLKPLLCSVQMSEDLYGGRRRNLDH
jgi:hypothetical protein